MAISDRPAWMTDLPPQTKPRHSVWWWLGRFIVALFVLKAVVLTAIILFD